MLVRKIPTDEEVQQKIDAVKEDERVLTLDMPAIILEVKTAFDNLSTFHTMAPTTNAADRVQFREDYVKVATKFDDTCQILLKFRS